VPAPGDMGGGTQRLTTPTSASVHRVPCHARCRGD
jgi:hypothetical protein